ncbi:hypothetical protein BDV95DRAFT_647975 [Massariosphaeria phaeospora]|uniref:Uncharacterized protein n=1 Tax=Massariosphaeria phaeospora TaxID=100035 RepID=A0A7C8M8X8_9PLEO|nr:hypothetical protein BDV95DRAFT_647975 [Massariosphaeria phaeospora]
MSCETNLRLADTLREWFLENGGWLNPDVDVKFNEERGYHICAAKPLSSFHVATCPIALTLSHLNLDPDQKHVPFVGGPLQKCYGKIPNEVLTYLLILEEYHAEPRSARWGPYFDALPPPSAMTNTLHFSWEDMHFLEATNLRQATLDRKEHLFKAWRQAMNMFATMGSEYTGNLRNIEHSAIRYAASIVSSRAFISSPILPCGPTEESFPILFPVVDLLNHSFEARVEWNFEEYKSFTLKVLDEVGKGDEILNNYAPKQNDELMLGYGFAIPDNPVEQFAVRAVIEPDIQRHLERMDAFNQRYIPFGFCEAILEATKDEQHFLRPQGHLYGRYENPVPYFRGIPPYVIYVYYLTAMIKLHIHVDNIDPTRPPPRVIRRMLIMLYQAVKQKCDSLPLNQESPTANSRQKYAQIYRNGQAKIIHTILHELYAPFCRLMVRWPQKPPGGPTIITPFEALDTLKEEFLPIHAAFNMMDWIEYRMEEEEDLLWMILLFVFASCMLTASPAKRDSSLICSWVTNLFHIYPLPGRAEEVDLSGNAAYSEVASTIGYYYSTDINDVGRQLVAPCPPITNGPTHRLGDRLVLWVLDVVARENLKLPDPVENDNTEKAKVEGEEEEEEEINRFYMYMRPWREDGSDEDWVYQ